MSQSQPDADAQADGLAAPEFPCRGFPAQTRHARLLGIYPQRQEGRFMQRVRIFAGILSARQWRALAQITRRFAPATPLHLTTRQDVELHDLSAEDVPRAQQSLAEAGLTSLGSGGDTLRNIVVCPCSAGGTGATPDLLPLGQAIARELAGYGGLFALPRKFKIALGCAQGCGRPFIHDLAFVAVQRNGQWGLKVIGAGSLGPKPGLGIELWDWIEPGEALPLAVGAVRLFALHGDRQNRAKARLRHVRQRLGDDAFRTALAQEFAASKAERAWSKIELAVAESVGAAARVLTFANGDITPEAADALATVADLPGFSVRIGTDHRVTVLAGDAAGIDDQFHQFAALATPARAQANIVACPGTRWCGRALADTNNLADAVRAVLADGPGAGLRIAISGCPNGCAASAVADIGIVGGRSSADGQSVEKYTVVSGGGKGASGVLAKPIVAGLSAQQTISEVIRLARALADKRPDAE
jgi:sulfite reductase (ferredoxin)